MTKEAWRDFICSPQHAGRHLSGIGKGFAGAAGDAVDLSQLQAFLERLSGMEDVVFLGNVVDLVTGGYAAFVQGDLRRILDALSSERLSREEIVGPGLRGNPRWDRTIVGHISGTLPITHFISRTAHRSFDLPENLLLSWLVRDLLERVSSVERRVGTSAMHPDLLSIETGCRAALSHDWFGSLPVPNRLEPTMRSVAGRHRRPEYRRAAALAGRSLELREEDRDAWWYSVLALLAVNWLEPVDEDDLFELFVLVMTLDVLEKEVGLGEPLEYGLVTSRRGRVALFERGDTRVEVHFDQTPASILGIRTAYGDVVRSHVGLVAGERRPDILLVIDDGDGRRIAVVEAKKTRDGRYTSDSVYKVFGYLHDFAAGGVPCEGVLIVPSGIAYKPSFNGRRPIRVASGDDRSGMGTALDAVVRSMNGTL